MSSHMAIWRIISLVFLLEGCGAMDHSPPKPPAVSNDSADQTNINENIDESEFASDSDSPIDTPEDGDEEYAEITEGTTKTLDEMLAECGDIDFDDPSAVVLNQQLDGLRIVEEGTFIGIAYKVSVDPTLTIVSSILQSVSTVNFAVAAEPFLAQSFAEKEVAGKVGTTTTHFYPRNERSDIFATDDAWDSVVCTIQPAYRTINNLGENNIVTEFEPALPASISPTGDAIRFDEEWLSGSRTWDGITATVIESSSETIPIGSTYTGSVTIREIEASGSVTDGEGNVYPINADRAFEMIADFGGPEITNAIGVRPVTKFYIDHDRRTFAAIQSEAGDGETPTATFVNP